MYDESLFIDSLVSKHDISHINQKNDSENTFTSKRFEQKT